MAETWVTREELATGEFPALCTITGITADARLPLTFRHQPDWIWILAPLGLPFLIAGVLGTEKIPAQLPVVADAVQSYRRVQRGATALTIVAFTAAMLGLLATSAPIIAVGLASLIGGLATAGHAGRRFPNGRPDDTGLWVRLLHVHPDFVPLSRHAGARRRRTRRGCDHLRQRATDVAGLWDRGGVPAACGK